MAAVLAAALAACGGSGRPPASHVAASAKAAAAPVVDPGDLDLVSAVSSVNTSTPVALKFRIEDQPRAGQPVHVQLAVVPDPAVDIDALHIALQESDGLLLDSTPQLDFADPAHGQTQHFEALLHATKTGVLSLYVTILIDTADASLSRNYAIPLIVM